ncbi:hypothetical protein [Acetonema longum]|uniref:Uncharacterized protein n=1 Tax=Acetonema longum DSM 6540 TaxID=1009370 RepID=F7NEB2_9FIRM|nr:hypothetical protein [Acetonema longum]EGO65624.1 hypothetical protein ALO_01874 [Acetonema longum DSM 6540]
MATDTANINLKLIESSDLVSKELLNTNTEILDAAIGALQEGQEPIPDMQEKLDDLENAQNLLAPRVTAAERNIAQLGSNVTGLQGDVAALQAQVDAKAEIDDTQTAAGTTYSSEKIMTVIAESLSELEVDNLSIHAIKQDLVANKYLKVNAAGTGIDQVDVAAGGGGVPALKAFDVGGDTVAVCQHDLGTRDVFVTVRSNHAEDNYDYPLFQAEATDENTVTVRFAEAPDPGEFRVLISGGLSETPPPPSIAIPMINPVNNSCSAILLLRSARTLKTLTVQSTDNTSLNGDLVPSSEVTLRLYKNDAEQYNFSFSTAKATADMTDVVYAVGDTFWYKVETTANNLKMLNVQPEFS